MILTKNFFLHFCLCLIILEVDRKLCSVLNCTEVLHLCWYTEKWFRNLLHKSLYNCTGSYCLRIHRKPWNAYMVRATHNFWSKISCHNWAPEFWSKVTDIINWVNMTNFFLILWPCLLQITWLLSKSHGSKSKSRLSNGHILLFCKNNITKHHKTLDMQLVINVNWL